MWQSLDMKPTHHSILLQWVSLLIIQHTVMRLICISSLLLWFCLESKKKKKEDMLYCKYEEKEKIQRTDIPWQLAKLLIMQNISPWLSKTDKEMINNWMGKISPVFEAIDCCWMICGCRVEHQLSQYSSTEKEYCSFSSLVG